MNIIFQIYSNQKRESHQRYTGKVNFDLYGGCHINQNQWNSHFFAASEIFAVAKVSRREIIRTWFSDANFGFCRVKILGNASAFPAFFSCTRQNLLSENSFDLKLMNFCADFGASDEIRLTPIEDDKPKDAENSKFKASSDYLATAKH